GWWPWLRARSSARGATPPHDASRSLEQPPRRPAPEAPGQPPDPAREEHERPCDDRGEERAAPGHGDHAEGVVGGLLERPGPRGRRDRRAPTRVELERQPLERRALLRRVDTAEHARKRRLRVREAPFERRPVHGRQRRREQFGPEQRDAAAQRAGAIALLVETALEVPDLHLLRRDRAEGREARQRVLRMRYRDAQRDQGVAAAR